MAEGVAGRGLEIVYRDIEDVRPYERNARTHTDEQIAQVAASIREFGWTNPILIDDSGMMVAGHARRSAAVMLGLDAVPTITLSGLTEDQVRAYVLADNQLAANAGWDPSILSSELRALQEAGYHLPLIGFSDADLLRLLAPPGNEGLTDPDDAPPKPARPTSVLGDVWLLGRHRLVCGDCTSPAHVDRCLAGVSPNIMVTDPPYGVDYEPGWREQSGLADKGSLATGVVLNDDRADWREAWALFPGAVAYVWHAGTKAHIVAASLAAAGFNIRAQIVWVKNRFAISRGHYHHQHEPVFDARRGSDAAQDNADEGDHDLGHYAVRDGQAGSWEGDRKQSTVWFIDHQKNNTGHGTQKPVECMERPLRNNSSPGQAVYEPFCGSGTTVIACERTGRSCHAMELDPGYVDVIVQRWQAYTGHRAVLEATRQEYAEVVFERARAAAHEADPSPAPDAPEAGPALDPVTPPPPPKPAPPKKPAPKPAKGKKGGGR